MKSLVTEIIPERLGPVTADFPDASYKNEAAGVLPTPVLAQFMTSYHYSVLRFLEEAGLSINDLTDDINNNQFWDAYYANTNRFILENSGLSPIAPRLISGKTRAASSMPDFLRANGASLEFTILGNATNLIMSTNNKEFVTDLDIVVAGIIAAPGTNNTADINDINIVADLYAGESDAVIPEIIINNVGSSVSSKVGQIVAFRTPSGEIFQGLLKTSTLITNVFRGYYFDDSGDPISRNVLSNGNTITVMNIGWAFIDADGVTVDVSYLTPIFSYDEPSAPATGQYWFNMADKVWNLHSGASLDVVDSVLSGQVVSDAANTIASRSNDFSNNFSDENNIDIEIDTGSIIKSKSQSSRCSVYGTELQVDLTKLIFDISTDLETPLVEAPSTDYYLYVSDQGQEVISDEKPYKRDDLKGLYHPYHSWRCVAVCYNDSSSDIVLTSSCIYNKENQNRIYIAEDKRSSGTNGGTFTAGAWQTRVFNTETGNLALLDSNQVIILPGLYRLGAYGTGYAVSAHKTKITNITDTKDVAVGTNAHVTGTGVMNTSEAEVEIRIDKTKFFELQHRCVVTFASLGFGSAVTFGVDEKFAHFEVENIN